MEDCLNSDLFDGKTLETLIIASVRTLRRGNKKWQGRGFKTGERYLMQRNL